MTPRLHIHSVAVVVRAQGSSTHDDPPPSPDAGVTPSSPLGPSRLRGRRAAHSGRLRLAPLLLGVVASLAVIALLACRDTLTGPLSSTPVRAAPSSRYVGSGDDGFGGLSSPNGGVWENNSPSGWDGSAERGLVGDFHFPTLITVRTSGTICQVPGILHGYDLCWGPQGTSDHQAAIGLWVDHVNAGSGVWWSTSPGPETFVIQGTAYAFRSGLNDPQPWGDYHWSCGRLAGNIPCWGYAGTSRLEFVRVPVAMTLVRSPGGTVAPGTAVTFTAGYDTAGLGGRSVDFSMLQWRWTPAGSADTVTCASASGSSCSRTVVGAGTMYASAYVNGEHQERSVHVDVPPARDSSNKLLLRSDPRRVLAGGGSVLFAAFPQRSTPDWGVTGWVFIPDSSAAHSSASCPRISTVKTCTDSIVRSGTMRVYGFVPTAPNDSADLRGYVGGDGLLVVTGPASYNPAGDPVTFTARAPGASSMSVVSWAFHATSTGGGVDQAAAPGTESPPCGTGETCTIRPTGAGYAVAVALVDGVEQTDSAYTEPEVIHLKVTASEGVVAAGSAVIFVAAAGKQPAKVAISGWRFVPDSGAPADCALPGNALSCTQTMTRSGRMWAHGTVNAVRDSAFARVDVRSTTPPPDCQSNPT